MRKILPQTAKEKLRTFARVALGLDVRFARSREFDIWRYEMDARYARRLFHFEQLLRQVDQIDGRIVECGVGPGRSVFAFSIISTHLTRSREIWGYDTFEGMPPPSVEDGKLNEHKGGWWSHSRRHVSELLQYNGLAQSFIESNITLIPGRLSESLSTYDGAPIALLHLDVDFYESYRTALESLYDHVASGGIVAFDEYLDPTWPGATRAIDEFFTDRPEEILKSPITELYYTVKGENPI